MSDRLIWLVLPALLLCCSGGRSLDRNGDGVVRVACLGDSNTFWGGFDGAPAWPHYVETGLAAAGVRLIEVNPYSGIGSRAIGTGMVWQGTSLDAETYVQQAIAAKSDVAIIAWGTNDVLADSPPDAVALQLEALAGELKAAGVDTLIALVPPITSPAAQPSQGHALAVVAVNDALRAHLPASSLVDFFTVPDSDFDADVGDPVRIVRRDGIHVNRAGEARRGAIAVQALLRADR